MTTLIVLVFLLVYLGLFLGGLPFLQLDRTGVALLGAIVLLATDVVDMNQVWEAVHPPTLALLFAFMVISAQLRLSGFYDWVVWRLDRFDLPPSALLGAVILTSALLSAVFSNDIVCLAMAPVLADACRARRLDPVPFLLALACAANLGSAATLIGNPQNMLIGERLALDFGGYLRLAIMPVGLGLAATWLILLGLSRRRWHLAAPVAANPEPESEATSHRQRAEDQAPGLDRWQTIKGLGVAGVLLLAFLFAPWPRDLLALAGAGLLLTSRRLHSHRMLGLVDWQLLVLFVGLFIVNHALQETGLPAQAITALAGLGMDLHDLAPLFGAGAILSNLVSNVPAVMLLLPAATEPMSGPVLALSSTLAGNLLIVSSIANIIVVQAAARQGLLIDWRAHARVGLPVTLTTLAIAALWLGVLQG
ncbi:SLC13 family permease [Allochromatium vinosum]|uniref:SLC13 family permease n=1 Tax=Allochromatium vinosum TaxID=1049 RepID=UPI001904B3FE|nr:SLC13 family permease [Allochromatium vinosum]MBK1656065.1 anion transporter [Allochromatium vinosum]